MKKIVRFFMLCLVFFAFVSPVIGQSSENFHVEPTHNDRYYLSPGMVYVAPDGIFININGTMVPVTKIESDASGVYAAVGMCPQCHWPTIGGFCTNPDCPSKR